MSDETGEGLLKKYEVSRLGDANNKHLGCRYFVLDPRHDPHAVTALQAYSDSVRDTHPHLSHDIDNWLTAVEIEQDQLAREHANPPSSQGDAAQQEIDAPPTRKEINDCFVDHDERCCVVHNTHSTPHRQCILR